MQVDPEYSRQYYNSLSDEALLAIKRSDLVEIAQKCYDAELAQRGLNPTAIVRTTASSEADTFVVVFVSGSWVEAEMVVCALEGHDIPALLLDDNICRIAPSAAYVVGGVKVVVDERNEEQALDVIGLAFSGGPPYAGTFAVVAFAGGLLLGLIALLSWRPRAVDRIEETGDLPPG